MACCPLVRVLVFGLTVSLVQCITFLDLTRLMRSKTCSSSSPVEELHFDAADRFQSACPLEVEVDENPNRAPKVLHQVRCLPGCSLCRQLKSKNLQFSCVQLYRNISVYYPESGDWDVLERFPVDCRCQAFQAQALPLMHVPVV